MPALTDAPWRAFRPAWTGQPGPAGVGDDGKLRVQLTPVAIDHDADGFGIGREPLVDQVRAKDGKVCDESGQGSDRVGPALQGLVKGDAGDVEILGSSAERSIRHHSRRGEQDRTKRERDQRAHAERDARFEAMMPGDPCGRH